MSSTACRYMETLKTGVESLLADKDLADVEIVVNHRIFKCHKSILVAISPYFRAMFTGGMRESKQNRITLQDVDEVPFQKLLEFIYSGKIKLLDDDVCEMLRIAALFQVDCLQEHCEEILLEQLKSDNCLDLYRLSCMYNCDKLRKRAWPAILDGFCTVWKSEEFKELSVDEIIAIIKEDCLVTMDEEHVCEAVLKWIETDLPNRKKHAYDIFSYVRLPHVSAEYLMNDLFKNQCLIEDSRCLKLLEEAQRFHIMPARRLDYSGQRLRYRSDDDLEEVLLVITENDDQHGSFYASNWCLWAFSFLQNRWFTLAQIPHTEIPGGNFAICAHGYDIYISGGENKPKALLKFESERNEWVVSSGQLKKARFKHNMVAIGNALYCVGGISMKISQTGQVMDYIEEYCIPGQRWRTVGELKYPVHSAATAVVSEQILVFGGVGKDNQPMSCIQCFHTRKKEMTLLSNIPFLSTKLLATTIGENVYVTFINHDRVNVLKLAQDFSFEDSSFELPADKILMSISHYDGCFIVIYKVPDKCGSCSVNKIFKVNLQTSESEFLPMKGIPKYMKACHRSCIDKRYLYHTYYQ